MAIGKMTRMASTHGRGERDAPAQAGGTPGKRTLIDSVRSGILPLAGAGTAFPHRARIEGAFGVPITAQAHVDEEAADACRELDANGFASGEQVGFANGEPDLWTAAHEAAHTVQQRRGVRLAGVVGTDGDPYEQIACEAADRVVAGESARNLFEDDGAATGAATSGHIQLDRSGRRDETRRETERDQRDRREPGGRGRGRRALGDDFDSDWAGRAILDRYLDGGGDWDINNASWTAYMKASDTLRRQVRVQVLKIARGYQAANAANLAGAPFFKTFHGQVENGEGIIGYQYLHGTNKDVGDFRIFGTVTTHNQNGESRALPPPPETIACSADDPPMVQSEPEPQVCEAPPPAPQPTVVEVPPRFTVELNASFQWNDKIDPNGKYMTDKIKDAIAWLVTLGGRSAYRLSITWNEPVRIVLDETGRVAETAGYPFD